MVGPNSPDELADLAEHGRFVRNLAWRLLHDEDAAEEVVQETMLAAVKARPSTRRSLRPWLATVARNVIRRRFRTTKRVRRREEAAAKPEALPSTADMAARAEMLKQVVDAVLSLDEPNRSTVLLRYYEDLPPREIAARLGVGVETVRGRLKRAVVQLRKRLDDHHRDGRQGWVPVVAGLCGFEVPAELLAAASGGSSGSAAAAGEAAPALTSATVGSLKGVAAAFLLGAGLAGVAVWSALPTPAGTAGVEAAARGGARAPANAAPRSTSDAPRRGDGAAVVLRGRAPTAEEWERARASNRRLRDAVLALEGRVAALAPPPSDPTAFRFGLPEQAPAYDRADWRQLARHLHEMTELLVRFREHVVSIEDPPAPLITSIVEHNQPLALMAIGVGADLEMSQPNAAFSHPAVLANLVRGALALAELPLSREQEVAIRTFGRVCVDELDRLEATWDEDAPVLARTVADVDAKLRFMNAVKDVLDTDQHAVLFRPETEGRLKLDLLSPGVIYILHHPVSAADREGLEGGLLQALFGLAGLETKDRDLSAYAWIARQWVDDLPNDPTPCPRWSDAAAFPLVEDVQTEVRAQVEATARILATGNLEPDEAESLRGVEMPLRPRIRTGLAWPLGEDD